LAAQCKGRGWSVDEGVASAAFKGAPTESPRAAIGQRVAEQRPVIEHALAVVLVVAHTHVGHTPPEVHLHAVLAQPLEHVLARRRRQLLAQVRSRVDKRDGNVRQRDSNFRGELDAHQSAANHEDGGRGDELLVSLVPCRCAIRQGHFVLRRLDDALRVGRADGDQAVVEGDALAGVGRGHRDHLDMVVLNRCCRRQCDLRSRRGQRAGQRRKVAGLDKAPQHTRCVLEVGLVGDEREVEV
jgi:hypothetical protein